MKLSKSSVISLVVLLFLFLISITVTILCIILPKTVLKSALHLSSSSYSTEANNAIHQNLRFAHHTFTPNPNLTGLQKATAKVRRCNMMGGYDAPGCKGPEYEETLKMAKIYTEALGAIDNWCNPMFKSGLSSFTKTIPACLAGWYHIPSSRPAKYVGSGTYLTKTEIEDAAKAIKYDLQAAKIAKAIQAEKKGEKISDDVEDMQHIIKDISNQPEKLKHETKELMRF